MDEAQWKAIETNMTDLCGAIRFDLFIAFMRKKCLLNENESDLICAKTNNDLKVIMCFDLIRAKARSWEETIEYLQTHKYLGVVATLNRSIGAATVPVWRTFICNVAKFYLGDHRVVGSFDVDGHSDLIESVWVDLQLEGIQNTIVNYGEIVTQMMSKNCRLAIVRGEAGSGKTSLVKKIAYDWAVGETTRGEQNHPFDLVLVIPASESPSTADILASAVGVFIGHEDSDTVDKVCEDLRLQSLNILIMLDSSVETSVHDVCPTFNKGAIFSSCLCDIYMLITTVPFGRRPLLDKDVATLNYAIVGLNEQQRLDFISRKCSPKGVVRAQELLGQSPGITDVCTNPLCLSILCFISEQGESAPTTTTQIYGNIVRKLVTRHEIKTTTVSSFDPEDWIQSEVLRNICSLALFGAIKNQYQFNQQEMQMCGVDEHYTFSSLLHCCVDRNSSSYMCAFPHRSLQDFLAAFYAVHYWGDKGVTEATGWPESIWPRELRHFFSRTKVEQLVAQLYRYDSLFSSFFFDLARSPSNSLSDKTMAALEKIFGRVV